MSEHAATVRLVRELPPAALRTLYASAGWWRAGDREEDLPALLAGSACAAGAFAGERLVGFGRVLSDGCSDAWIQDVVVLPAWRGRGLGRALVAALRDWCRARGIAWVWLVAEPGSEGLYRRLGFAALDGWTAMRLAPEDP